MGCAIDECPRKVLARGWCSRHYRRWRQHGDPAGGGRSPAPHGAPETFMAEALRSDTDECIVWPYALSHGYARIQGQAVSRLVLEATVGPPPEPGSYAAHAPGICHNPACINARHLRWASAWENSQDKWADGTIPIGETHPGAKLTRGQVLAIIADKRTLQPIADDYGVGAMTISRIKNRKTWTWLIGGAR